MLGSESNSTLDFKLIELEINAFPGLRSNILTLLISLIESPNKECSIPDAVKRINKLYPTRQPFFYNESTFLWLFWESILMVARRIPYNNHLKQELLVEFLRQLRRKKIGTFDVCRISMCFLFPSLSHLPTYYPRFMCYSCLW
jgi:hypothetical protein